MIKKALILSVLTLTGFANANASGLITSSQLTDYENAVNYLKCSNAGLANCGNQFASTKAARGVIHDYKGMNATGVNASKKASLDGQAVEALLTISREDMEDYLKHLGTLNSETFLDELRNDAKVVISSTMPDAAATESFGTAAEVFTKQKTEDVYSKQDLVDILAESSVGDDRAVYTPSYLQGVVLEVKGQEDINYHLYNGSYNGRVTIEKTDKATAVGMQKDFKTVLELQRFADAGYEIKLATYAMDFSVSLKQEVINEHVDKVVEPSLKFDMVNNTYDEKWVNRYDDIKEQDRQERSRYATVEIVRYTADSLLRHYDKAYRYERALELATMSEAKVNGFDETLTGYFKEIGGSSLDVNRYKKLAEKEKEKAREYYNQGEKYLSDLRAYSDTEARAVYSYYMSLGSFDYEKMKQTRMNEEFEVNKAVVGFKVYVQ